MDVVDDQHSAGSHSTIVHDSQSKCGATTKCHWKQHRMFYRAGKSSCGFCQLAKLELQ
jgi:hypothetical protein